VFKHWRHDLNDPGFVVGDDAGSLAISGVGADESGGNAWSEGDERGLGVERMFDIAADFEHVAVD